MERWPFRLNRLFVLAVCLALTAAVVWAARSSAGEQGQLKLSMGVPTRVSLALSGQDISQIWAAGDPSDSRYIIACGYEEFPHQNVSTGYVYSSADGGAHWRQTILENGTKFVSEEACTYAFDGRAYFVAGESDTSTGEPRHEFGHMNLFASADHGMTWSKIWKRKDGWIDWTSLAAAPANNGSPGSLVIFGNSGTDKLGHWWTSRPVAVGSRDAGISFTNLVAPLQPAGLHYIAVWSSGSTVLPDGTALFSASTSLARPKEKPNAWWDALLRVEMFAYSPSSGLRSRAVVRVPKKKGIFTVSLAQDVSQGRFSRRLYSAWLEYNLKLDGTGVMWLGTSDDQGYNWSARPISPESCLGDIKVGVAPDGTLGVIWSEDSRRLYVATSTDGGRTFGPPVTVALHEPGALATSDAVAFNEYWAGEVLALQAGKSLEPYVDENHLGVSVRMGQPIGLGDYALVAGTDNAFHALWAQVEPDGTHGLFARSIQPGSGSGLVTSELAKVPVACSDSGSRVHPPLPGPAPALAPSGQRDISKSFFLRVENINYDNATRIVTAHVVLLNKGKGIVRAPVSLFGIGLHSDYGNVVAVNASGEIQGQPFWDASQVIPGEGLRPGGESKPLALKFKIIKFQPLQNGGRGGDATAMLVRIYQKQ